MFFGGGAPGGGAGGFGGGGGFGGFPFGGNERINVRVFKWRRKRRRWWNEIHLPLRMSYYNMV